MFKAINKDVVMRKTTDIYLREVIASRGSLDVLERL